MDAARILATDRLADSLPSPLTSQPTNHPAAVAALQGVCHIDNCFCDLSPLGDYHQRFLLCDYHLKVRLWLRAPVHVCVHVHVCVRARARGAHHGACNPAWHT